MLFARGTVLLAGAMAAQLSFLFPGGAVPAGSAQHGCSLTLRVDGLRNRKGVIGCAVFKTPNGWPEHDDQAYTRKAIPITSNTAVLEFPDIPPARYGIACLHDENANHHLDRNFFRVPTEGFGFANNPRVRFSPPSWRSASIEVTCPATRVDIHLIYK